MHAILFLLLLFAALVSAQFQFFEQMFGGGGGGGGPHQQQAQNMPSDSNWYQAQYEGGKSTPLPTSQILTFGLDMRLISRFARASTLRQVPLPAHPLLRALPAPLPLRLPRRRGQGRVRRGQHGVCVERGLQGGRGREEGRVGEEGAVMIFLGGDGEGVGKEMGGFGARGMNL